MFTVLAQVAQYVALEMLLFFSGGELSELPRNLGGAEAGRKEWGNQVRRAWGNLEPSTSRLSENTSFSQNILDVEAKCIGWRELQSSADSQHSYAAVRVPRTQILMGYDGILSKLQ